MASPPGDHAERMDRVRTALDGVSMGDAFGSQFFIPSNRRLLFSADRESPPGDWGYTDDTEMALGIAEVLDRHGTVDQDNLAVTFARRYALESYRGYGPGMHKILPAIGRGEAWAKASKRLFNGGSFGNGSAMRVAPVGAYFADDLDRVAEEAKKSAEVTHCHPEGIAGAVACAVAGAVAWQTRDRSNPEEVAAEFFDAVLRATPAGLTRDRIDTAVDLPFEASLDQAVTLLGNGSQITCPDTVAFCLWVAAKHLGNFVDAMWDCARAGGDLDTTSAIVGGIVVMATGREGIPDPWFECRESLVYGSRDG